MKLDALKREGESPVTQEQIENLRNQLKTIVSMVERALVVSDTILPSIALVFEIFGKDLVKELIIQCRPFVIFSLENSKKILTLSNELTYEMLKFISQNKNNLDHFIKFLNDLQLEEILQEIEAQRDNSDNLENIISKTISAQEEKIMGSMPWKQNFDLIKLSEKLTKIFNSHQP